MLFESIAKIAKEKLLSNNFNKLSISSESDAITTTSSLNLDDFIAKLEFIQETSNKIEETLNEIFKNAKEKYIRKAKAIISNLRFNSDLYLALFEEKITADEVATMEEKVNNTNFLFIYFNLNTSINDLS